MNRHLQISQAVLGAILESPRDIVIFALDPEYRYLAFNQNHARTIKLIWGVDVQVGMEMLSVIGRPRPPLTGAGGLLAARAWSGGRGAESPAETRTRG